MGDWYSNKEFVSVRAECQLVKDGVQSWEAEGLLIGENSISRNQESLLPTVRTVVLEKGGESGLLSIH